MKLQVLNVCGPETNTNTYEGHIDLNMQQTEVGFVCATFFFYLWLHFSFQYSRKQNSDTGWTSRTHSKSRVAIRKYRAGNESNFTKIRVQHVGWAHSITMLWSRPLINPPLLSIQLLIHGSPSTPHLFPIIPSSIHTPLQFHHFSIIYWLLLSDRKLLKELKQWAPPLSPSSE